MGSERIGGMSRKKMAAAAKEASKYQATETAKAGRQPASINGRRAGK